MRQEFRITEQDWHRMTSRIRKPDGSVAPADLVRELKLSHQVHPHTAIKLVRDRVRRHQPRQP